MDPKLKAKLDKEITKGKIPMDAADAEEPIDADLDMIVARSVEEVWKTYDPKGTGFMDKKMVEKFFNVRRRLQCPHEIRVFVCGRVKQNNQRTLRDYHDFQKTTLFFLPLHF